MALERRINELLHNGSLDDSREYWGNGDWPKLIMQTWLRYIWDRTYICLFSLRGDSGSRYRPVKENS